MLLQKLRLLPKESLACFWHEATDIVIVNVRTDVFMSCRAVSEEQLAEVVARVDKAEAEGHISPWEEADVPSSILEDQPEPGSIVSKQEIPVLGGTELVLSNGMKASPATSDSASSQNTECITSI